MGTAGQTLFNPPGANINPPWSRTGMWIYHPGRMWIRWAAGERLINTHATEQLEALVDEEEDNRQRETNEETPDQA